MTIDEMIVEMVQTKRRITAIKVEHAELFPDELKERMAYLEYLKLLWKEKFGESNNINPPSSDEEQKDSDNVER